MNKIKYICSIVLVYSFLFNCLVSCKTASKQQFKPVELYFKMDLYNNESKELVSYRDSIILIESEKNILLYSIAKPYEKVIVQMDKEGNLKSQTLSESGIRYSYFFCKTGIQNGVLFDSLKTSNYKLINTDSFIKRKIHFKSEMFHSDNDSLVSADKIGQQLTERYVPRIKKDDSYPDSIILIFKDKKPDDINYCLTPGLDSFKKMKLSKAVFVTNSRPAKNNMYETVPRREIIFELRKPKENIVSNELLILFQMADSILRE